MENANKERMVPIRCLHDAEASNLRLRGLLKAMGKVLREHPVEGSAELLAKVDALDVGLDPDLPGLELTDAKAGQAENKGLLDRGFAADLLGLVRKYDELFADLLWERGYGDSLGRVGAILKALGECAD